MSIEQQNYEPSIDEGKDSLNLSIEDLHSEIDESLSKLWKIDTDNEQLNKIKEKITSFKDNKEALWIINDGLKQIGSDVEDIARQWKEEIKQINKNMIAKLEQYEREEDLKNLEDII